MNFVPPYCALLQNKIQRRSRATTNLKTKMKLSADFKVMLLILWCSCLQVARGSVSVDDEEAVQMMRKAEEKVRAPNIEVVLKSYNAISGQPPNEQLGGIPMFELTGGRENSGPYKLYHELTSLDTASRCAFGAASTKGVVWSSPVNKASRASSPMPW